MGSLVDTFGDTPRVRMLEALGRLGGHGEFSIPEAAHEAKLFRPSAGTAIQALANDGFLVRTSTGWGAKFRVASEAPRVQIVNYAEAALALARPSNEASRSAKTAPERFRTVTARILAQQMSAQTASYGAGISLAQMGSKPAFHAIASTTTGSG